MRVKFLVPIICLTANYSIAQISDTTAVIQPKSPSSEQQSDSLAASQRSIGYLRGGLSAFFAYDHPGAELVFLTGITVGPGFRLVQNENYAVTLSAPITLGFGSSSTYSFFGFDAPAMMDLNVGSAAGNNKNAKLGFIVGAGLAHFYSYNLDKNTDTELRAHVTGYRYEAGICVGRGSSKYETVVIMINYGQSFSQQESFTPTGGRVFGISIQYIVRNPYGHKRKP